jgi:hypothetical protein
MIKSSIQVPSPILIFQEERVPSPILIFQEERVPSPILIFQEERVPSPIVVVDDVSPPLEEGTFFSDEVDFCAFVLSRGQRKGEVCGKITTDSALLECAVPACIHHLAKYEEKIMLQMSFLSVRPTYTASYAEDYDDETPASVKLKKPKPVFALHSIPKAIERTRECPVCLEENNPLLYPCGHTVCFECTNKLIKEECPTCREPFKKKQLRLL